MGAGPYRFVEYADGIAYLEANPSYYKGAPSIPYVQVQTVEEDIRVASATQGKMCIRDSPQSAYPGPRGPRRHSGRFHCGRRCTGSAPG